MNIYYFKPFALDKNLGKEYNRYMELLPNDDDYACFIDADTMFLCPDYGVQIYNTIIKYPNAGMFTCTTNRVGNVSQLYESHMSEISDIKHHKRLSRAIWNRYKTNCQVLKAPISGVMMVIQKKIWARFQFSKGLLGVDNDISKRIINAGLPIYLMRGIYIFHYYRLIEGAKFKKHLK